MVRFLWTENIYLQYVTRPEKTSLIYIKYTYLYYDIYLFFCVRYTKSVIFIEFLRKFCVVFNLKDGKLG